MIPEKLLAKINDGTVEFIQVIAHIDAHYEFTPTAFKNGDKLNAADENNGACKVFAFAKLAGLTKEQTLACFGKFYREDVLQNPEGTDHENIRNYMKTGRAGILFCGPALKPRE